MIITLVGCCVGADKEGADKVWKIARLFAGHTPRVCVMARTGPTRLDWDLVKGVWKPTDMVAKGSKWQIAYSHDKNPPDPIPLTAGPWTFVPLGTTMIDQKKGKIVR